MVSLKKQALTGVYWSSIQQFSNQGIRFVISIILARLLLPEEFGLLAMIVVFVGIANALMDAGLGQSLIRTKDPSQEDYSTVFFFNLMGSVVIYISMFFAAPYIANFYNQEPLISIIRWYSITFIINAFSSIQLTRLTKQMNFKVQTQIAIPSLLISGFVGILMAYYGFGVWSLIVSGLVQTVVSTVQLWYWAKWTPSWVFCMKKFKYHFTYGYKLTLSGILDTLFVNAYTIIIGKFFTPAMVGFYNRANTLKQLPVNNISVVLNKVTFPLFAEVKDDNIRLKSIYKRILQLVIFLVAPILFILAALAEPLFRFLFTEKWLPAVPYFQILAFNGVLYPIHSYNLNILKVKGRSDLFLKLEILKKILIVLVILISFQFGVYGLLYGSVLSSVLAFFINTHYTGKFISYASSEQIKDILPIIFVALGCAIMVYFMDSYLKAYTNYDILRLIVGGFTGSTLYLLLAYLFKMNSLTEIFLLIKRK